MASVGEGVKAGGAKGLPRSLEGLIARIDEEIAAAGSLSLYATLRDEKVSGTPGGTATSGSYQTRDLNTKPVDEIGITLAANQFTLPTGTYRIRARAQAFNVDNHKAKLRNISDATDEIIGSNARADSTSGNNQITDSWVQGQFVVSGSPKVFEIQHRVFTTVATNGFGFQMTFGDVEVYAVVELEKVA